MRRANELNLPLLVYQGLNPDYPEANDRIHPFILQSARDVARTLAERGIHYRFHLRREAGGEPPPVTARLADGAACVVVDDFPAFRAALRRLEGFLREGLDAYADDRSDPGRQATSGLSPYLRGYCGARTDL